MFKNRRSFVFFAGLPGLALAAMLTACGGGGTSSESPFVPASPAPPGIGAVAAIGGTPLANASVVFSCGCTGQAGTTTADANGNYTVASSTTAIPAAPSPTYTTVPGRNYLEVITASNNAQAWDIAFLGSTPTRNHTLNATNTSDQYTTAAALFVFYSSLSSTNPTAFDTWNFDTIASWVTLLQTAPLSQETTLLNDIVNAQTNHQSLYPSNGAAWAPAGTIPNTTIATDLNNVKAAAPATRLPQQCTPAGIPCAVPTP